MKGMKGEETTLGEMFEFAMNHLPDGWELRLTVVKDEVSLDFEDPDSNPVDRCHDDMGTGDMIHDYVNYARYAEGLPAVGWDGSPDATWGVS